VVRAAERSLVGELGRRGSGPARGGSVEDQVAVAPPKGARALDSAGRGASRFLVPDRRRREKEGMTNRTAFLLSILSCIVGAAHATAQAGRYRDAVFGQITVQTNVPYGQAVSRSTQLPEALLLDLYEPAGDTVTDRPAIVLVHGGGFVAGTKSDPNYVQIAETFARRGYVAVSIDYRLARPPFAGTIGQAIAQAVIDASHDFKAAVRWLRAHASQLGIDADRIVCLGGSSGGITCLNAAYADGLGEGTSGNPGFSSEVQAVISLWGAIPNLADIEAGEAPMQIIHGTNDPIVPYQNALDLKAQADSVGVYAELLPIPAGGHAEYQAYLQTYQVDSFAFLYEQLRLGELAGLAVRPGFASPGTVTLDTFGSAGDLYAILLAPAPDTIVVPGLGTLCIGPAEFLFTVADGTLPTTPRLAAASWSMPVPAGLAGFSAFWQAVHLDPSAGRWVFANCVETPF
jgi:acetyl esterase/lipase